ncbi:methyltransferase domain-containing protein [Streptomyces sp. NPDC005438]|uniref:methyltransferase domain-containing protein n=1 Tax=Streptomyces sp. NPDC005438 TaxID=3156880 RepID=UPI00339DB83D
MTHRAPSWDPERYLRHQAPRLRPVHDLLARVPDPPHPHPRVADLGCGPGGPSLPLLERWPTAHVTGYDSSPAMLGRAAPYAGGTPEGGRIDFRRADLQHWHPDGEQLLFSNAALQWVTPEDGPGHHRLLPRWLEALPPGGVLAFQVPGNHEAPSHALLNRLRRSPRWRELLGPPREPAVLDPAGYHRLLAPLAREVDAWETTYLHLLQGPDPVLDWISGTGLRPVLDRLEGEPEAREEFLDSYAALLREAYPATEAGTYFPFRRIFVVAVRR